MLSTAAWNAFLKTLEEPPPNTVFVLATTEASKVPATVVDRCHRFDFHRPTVEQIASVVRRAAQAESIEIPPAAVAALARARRRAASATRSGTLEQIVTYSGQRDRARGRARGARRGRRARCWRRPSTRSPRATLRRALRTLEECVEQGRDAASFASDLEVRARELLRRAGPWRGAGRALADARGRRGACARRPSVSPTPPSCACWSCSARRWRRCAPARMRARAWSSRSSRPRARPSTARCGRC